MEESALYNLITASSSLEGSTLTLAQNTRLLKDGISSEGKTIAEQLLNLDLKTAYEAAIKDAASHQVWSGYRVKMLASKALRSYGFDCNTVRSEADLQKICQEANEARMHSHSLKESGLYSAGFMIHFRISKASLWPKGNDIMARLLMNMIQIEFGLEPLAVKQAEKYSALLQSAITEDKPELFTKHAAEVLVPSGKCKLGVVKNSTRILELLATHPRYTTSDLAGILGISNKGVEKHLANLKKTGALVRLGPDKGGYWRVTYIPRS